MKRKWKTYITTTRIDSFTRPGLANPEFPVMILCFVPVFVELAGLRSVAGVVLVMVAGCSVGPILLKCSFMAGFGVSYGERWRMKCQILAQKNSMDHTASKNSMSAILFLRKLTRYIWIILPINSELIHRSYSHIITTRFFKHGPVLFNSVIQN